MLRKERFGGKQTYSLLSVFQDRVWESGPMGDFFSMFLNISGDIPHVSVVPLHARRNNL